MKLIYKRGSPLALCLLMMVSFSRAQVSFPLPGNTVPVNITKAEYFFDTDPGLGKATALTVSPAINTTISNASISISGLANGVHRFYTRTADASGHWSLTNEEPFFIVSPVAFPANAALPNVVKAEYFFDTDPGIGKATPITVTSPGTNTTVNAAIPVSGLSTSMVHRLYLRTANSYGRWSLTNIGTLAVITTGPTIPANPVPGNITLLEYFFDTDPGFGKGTPVVVSGTTNLVNYTFPVDVSSLSIGTHNLFVRVFDGWSQTSVLPLGVANPLPITLLSFTAMLQSDKSVLLNWVTTNETNNQYFAVERSGDGAAFDSIGMTPGAGTTNVQQNYSFIDAALAGMNYYRLKQVDIDGHSTYSPVVTVKLQASIAFSLTPNPTHDLLTVDMGSTPAGTGVFRIVDMQGRILLSVNATATAIQQINVSGLAPGAYILQYLTETNSTTARFIKF